MSTVKPHNVDVDGDTPILWVLRDVIGLPSITQLVPVGPGHFVQHIAA